MKIFFIILDGCADVGERTPYQLARKPAMDALAAKGACGLLDIGYKGTPESDFGYLHLLGLYSDETYTGRGYLEALGLGMEDIKAGDICARGNFATIGGNGNILDRRAGRDETGLEEFAARLDGTEIDGVHFFVRKTAGHRAVVVMRALEDRTKLSDQILSNDPGREGVPVMQIKPKVPEAKFTASVLNKFVFKSNKILSEEVINKERKLPANMLLLRGFGRKKENQTFNEKYRMKACCVAGIPILKGVACFLGIDIITVHGATGYPDTDLKAKFGHAVEALKKYDFVLLHINGTDILSHDGKPREKTKFIEKIDQHLGEALKKIDLEKTVVVLTSDHRTASEPGFESQRHTKDPVPVLISGGGIRPGRITRFDEQACEKGFFLKGNDLIPFVLSQLR